MSEEADSASPFGAAQVQHVEDVCPDSRGGSGSESHDGNSRKVFLQVTQPLVVRPEVMAPLTDAVCLINYKPCQALPLVELL